VHEEDPFAHALDRVLRFDPAQLGRYVPHRSAEGRAAGGNSPGMGSSWLEPVDGNPASADTLGPYDRTCATSSDDLVQGSRDGLFVLG
jgi:hypothetical protein